jgi:hypothetical protein
VSRSAARRRSPAVRRIARSGYDDLVIAGHGRRLGGVHRAARRLRPVATESTGVTLQTAEGNPRRQTGTGLTLSVCLTERRPGPEHVTRASETTHA